MKRYLDPKSDLVFKRVFGEHAHILRAFLNAVLPLPEGEKIVSLEYLSPEQVPEIPILKFSIVDVRCEDQLGRRFIVEMQMEWSEVFLKRFFFNTSKAYVQQLDKGEAFEYIQPVYGLCLLNDYYDRNTEDYYHHFKILSVRDPKREIQGLQMVLIEIPKFKSLHAPGAETDQEIWLRYLQETGKHEKGPEEIAAYTPEVKEALELAQVAAFSRGEMEAYDRYWDAVSTHKSLMNAKLSEGIALGHSKGLEEGLAKGKALALQEAFQKMVASGIPAEQARSLLGMDF